MKFRIIFCLLFLMSCARDFDLKDKNHVVYMDLRASCKSKIDKNCYFYQSEGAEKVLRNLGKLGVGEYILPTNLDDHKLGDLPYNNFVDKLVAAGGRFYTAELRYWIIASNVKGYRPENKKVCKYYRESRINRLLWMKKRYGKSYLGQYIDEPRYSELEIYKNIIECIQKEPGLRDTEYYINFLPMSATEKTLTGEDVAGGHYTVDTLGGCRNFSLKAIENSYEKYIRDTLKYIKANKISFDFYPYSSVWAGCKKSYRTLMLRNLEVVNKLASEYRVDKLSYVQGYFDRRDPSSLPLKENFIWLFENLRLNNYDKFTLFISHPFPHNENFFFDGLLDKNSDPSIIYKNMYQAMSELNNEN